VNSGSTTLEAELLAEVGAMVTVLPVVEDPEFAVPGHNTPAELAVVPAATAVEV
jgi:hypothetical protein